MRIHRCFISVWLASGLAACGAESKVDESDSESVGISETFLSGNGTPSGAHYNLNIIGVPKNKPVSNENNGRRIFVPLQGKTKINLSQGTFQVLDHNGTDGTAAFQLPAPDPDGDGTTAYKVYARALGKPGGASSATTCATDSLGDLYCSVESMVMVRNSGRSRFEDVSKQLLSILVDLDGDGTLERYSLFDDALQDYYWDYDNNGMKLVQLRFYSME